MTSSLGRRRYIDHQWETFLPNLCLEQCRSMMYQRNHCSSKRENKWHKTNFSTQWECRKIANQDLGFFFCFVNLTALSLLIQLALFTAMKEVVGKMRFSWPKFLHGNYRMAGTVRREVLTTLPSIIYVNPFHKIDYNWGHWRYGWRSTSQASGLTVRSIVDTC